VRHPRSLVHMMLALPLCLVFAMPADGAKSTYRTAFARWSAAESDFGTWQLDGVNLEPDGVLRLDPANTTTATDPYPPGGYNGRNFYNGGSFVVGSATSPELSPAFAFSEAIASWNADTPAGSWIETLIRARIGNRWTKWYNLGIWAADTSTVERHSVNAQGDADGSVAVDTLVLNSKAGAANAFQLRLRLFSTAGTSVPSVHNASVATSTTPGKAGAPTPGDPDHWNQVLAVPECSQMVYPDGGEVWCSPTSTSMVLAYWSGDAGPCEPRVRAAVDGVFDWIYDGHGNWPFNTAYAATQELEGYVARFTSLAQAEAWIAAGVPVIMSYGWKKSSLDGAPIPSSNGHLAVLVGFDTAGNPIVNDPAAATDDAVQRTYNRAQLEKLWLESSGGTVYLIYPSSHLVPSL
jgi:hypothetical protein